MRVIYLLYLFAAATKLFQKFNLPGYFQKNSAILCNLYKNRKHDFLAKLNTIFSNLGVAATHFHMFKELIQILKTVRLPLTQGFLNLDGL